MQICQKQGGVSALSSAHLTTKVHPCHVCSDSMPSRQIIGQTITYNKATAASKSSPDGTQHSEWHHVTMSTVQLSVRTALAMSVYAKMPAVKYYAICITLVAVLLKLYVKLTPRINFYPIQEIGPKVGGGCSFMMGAFSQDYSLYLTHLCSKYGACPYHLLS